MPEDQKLPDNSHILTNQEIDACISALEHLLADTNQLFELLQRKRTALLKASGKLSRPTRDEHQQRRKDAKKAAKRKMIAKDTHARKTTGIRSARECSIICSSEIISCSFNSRTKH